MMNGLNDMKTVGIIGAMEEEIALFTKNMDNVCVKEKAGITFSIGDFLGMRVVVGKSGIGKVNAAVCSQVMIDLLDVDGILCCGVAGALDDRLQVGDVVISTSVIQYDVNVSAFGYEPGYIPRMNRREFLADKDLIDVAYNCSRSCLRYNKIYLGKVLTGDRFVSDPDEKERLRKTFNGSCVEMEGGAIGHVCFLNNIPFVIIRSISDTADGRAAEDYRRFVHLAANNSYEIVSSIITHLKDLE